MLPYELVDVRSVARPVSGVSVGIAASKLVVGVMFGGGIEG